MSSPELCAGDGAAASQHVQIAEHGSTSKHGTIQQTSSYFEACKAAFKNSAAMPTGLNVLGAMCSFAILTGQFASLATCHRL